MSFDRENQGEAEFERRLLESARGDAPPHDVQHAWARFAGSLSLVVPAHTPPGAGHGARVSTGAAVADHVATSVAARALRKVALTWLLLGAIGGSAVTAVVAIHHDRRSPNSPSPVVGHTIPARTVEPPGARAPLPGPNPAHEPGTIPAARITAAVASAKYPGQGSARSVRHTRDLAPSTEAAPGGDFHDPGAIPHTTDGSTLAAQVARVDAARAANLGGDYDQAIRLIERYHQDFPEGALAPDADVVALEAVAAKGDRAATARRAALFLSRYPSDPHTPRVKWLAAH